ncbi:5-methyltetrahydropteroyltriglutamate--homocysteine S-methyltransferase [Spirochaeta dissipatitropha]
MAFKTHSLGLPRIGKNRELKFALESFWKGALPLEGLKAVAAAIQEENLQEQGKLDIITVGDFSYYDRMLDTALMFDLIPARFRDFSGSKESIMSAIARGSKNAGAAEMRKWFNTNYHYIVPEFDENSRPGLNPESLVEAVKSAGRLGKEVKAALIGPLSFLFLGKSDNTDFSPLELLPELTQQYAELIRQLHAAGADWIQLEEPILVQDNLDDSWKAAFRSTYSVLAAAAGTEQGQPPRILLTSYFERITENLELIAELPVDAVHLDLSLSGSFELLQKQRIALKQQLSLGIIDGRNVWKTDIDVLLPLLKTLITPEDTILLAPSCSLLHLPYSLIAEKQTLPHQLLNGLSFAHEKLAELELTAEAANQLCCSLQGSTGDSWMNEETRFRLKQHRRAIASFQRYQRQHAAAGPHGTSEADSPASSRAPYEERKKEQDARLNLPLFPTTTIGSFPQTADLRRVRRNYRQGILDDQSYQDIIRAEIRRVIRIQEEIGLDVLVHGEPERNDMVEYFTELLDGCIGTANGWVQSYGSRCVKPAIIWADIQRPLPMTLDWIEYAQSLTSKPVKGMLTGPVTMVKWSFQRSDISMKEQVFQMADAIGSEVRDLEKSGISIIQIDEAAFKEAQPIKSRDWQDYGDWAAEAFRRCSRGIENRTQIHTHMCYSDFSTILDAVCAMDADVLSIESSRSEMSVLHELADIQGLNEFGPGIYDIHSPQIPDEAQLEGLIRIAVRKLAPERIWVNPDCGLKTRGWAEIVPSLQAMTAAAKRIRHEYAEQTRNLAAAI